MGSLLWVRGSTSGTATAAPFQTNTIISGIDAGATVRRTIVTFDWWVDSNTTEFIDVGATVNLGVSWSTSAVAPTITPFTDPSSLSPRWLWWDQLETRPIEIFDVAGTIYYLAKNGNGSRTIDTRTQYKNATALGQHLWFSIEPNPAAVGAWSDTYWTISSSVLLEEP